jgi:hypothetical protein
MSKVLISLHYSQIKKRTVVRFWDWGVRFAKRTGRLLISRSEAKAGGKGPDEPFLTRVAGPFYETNPNLPLRTDFAERNGTGCLCIFAKRSHGSSRPDLQKRSHSGLDL